MAILLSAWLFLKGKKTYIVAALSIALGLLTKDVNLVLGGLGLAGLREALPARQS